MKNIKLILLVTCMGSILASCNSSLLVSKRHYNNGYYVDLNFGNKKKTFAAERVPAKNDNTAAVKTNPVVASSVTSSNDYDKNLEVNADKNLSGDLHRNTLNHKLHKAMGSSHGDAKKAFVMTSNNGNKITVYTDDEVVLSNRTFNDLNSAAPVSGGSKSQIVAAILCFLVGVVGIHRFYLGYTLLGILQILTLGGLGIWTLIDFIRILMGTLKPKDGSYDETF
jgi:TM2 domain-containing membrane protein YozV